MKKLLLSLGSVAAIVAPVAAVVACGDDKAAFTLSSELNTDKTILTVTVTGKDAKIDDLTKEIAAKGDAKTTTIKFKVGTKELPVTIAAGTFNTAADVKTAITSTIEYNSDLGKILARSSANELKNAPDYATIITTKATSQSKLSDLANSIKLTKDDFEIPAASATAGATAKIEKVEAPKTALTAEGDATYKVTLNEGKGTVAKLIVDVKVHFGTTSGGTTSGGSQTTQTAYTAAIRSTAAALTDANWNQLTANDFELTAPASTSTKITAVAAQGNKPAATGNVVYKIKLGDANGTVNDVTVPVTVSAPAASIVANPTAIRAVAKTSAKIKATDDATALTEALNLAIADFDITDATTNAALTTGVELVPVTAADVDFANKKVTFTFKVTAAPTVTATVDVTIA